MDWSWFNNHGWRALPPYKPFDVDKFCAEHPEVEGAVIRFLWPSGKVDKHYAHYYDGFTRNGKKVAGYGWAHPFKTVADVMESWKVALGDRVPKLIGGDYEDVTDWNPTKTRWTNTLQNTWEAQQVTFPDSAHMSYSRGSWLDDHIITGPWFRDIKWWLAHWIYPVTTGKQAAHWREIDELLPIDNDWTPFRGRVVKIKQENVIGWQGSEQGAIVPRSYSDLDWMLKSFIAPIYNGGVPPVPPGLDPVPVEVVVPADKTTVTVREV